MGKDTRYDTIPQRDPSLVPKSVRMCYVQRLVSETDHPVAWEVARRREGRSVAEWPTRYDTIPQRDLEPVPKSVRMCNVQRLVKVTDHPVAWEVARRREGWSVAEWPTGYDTIPQRDLEPVPKSVRMCNVQRLV